MVRAQAVIAALVLAVIAAPAAAADQFDLICESKYHDGTFHYRLDLAANQWCVTSETKDRFAQFGRCAPEPFYAVSSDTIVFGSYAPLHVVDRVTGAWTYKDGGSAFRGTCSPAPFSGFPKLDTKF